MPALGPVSGLTAEPPVALLPEYVTADESCSLGLCWREESGYSVRFNSRSNTSSVDVKLLIMLRVSRFGTSIGLCALDDDSFLARLVDFRPVDQILGSMYPPSLSPRLLRVKRSTLVTSYPGQMDVSATLHINT